jgi:hypothetical protein
MLEQSVVDGYRYRCVQMCCNLRLCLVREIRVTAATGSGVTMDHTERRIELQWAWAQGVISLQFRDTLSAPSVLYLTTV